MIIGITGKKGSGKDSFAKELEYAFISEAIFPARLAFADPIKEGLMAMFGVDCYTEDKEAIAPGMDVSIRYLMQTLGTEWGRQMIGDNVWINRTMQRIDFIRGHDEGAFIVTDVRFDNEAMAIYDQGGVVVEIVRPEVNGDRHSSEAGIKFVADYTIINDGSLDDLQMKADGLVSKLVSRFY